MMEVCDNEKTSQATSQLNMADSGGRGGLLGCRGRGACRLITQDFLPHNEEQQSPQRMRCACLSAGSCVFNDET